VEMFLPANKLIWKYVMQLHVAWQLLSTTSHCTRSLFQNQI